MSGRGSREDRVVILGKISASSCRESWCFKYTSEFVPLQVR